MAVNCPCKNCGAPSIYRHLLGDSSGLDVRYGSVECANGCGWSVSSLTCPKCTAKIQGNFLGGVPRKTGRVVNFIFYSALLALGGIVVLFLILKFSMK